MATLTPKTPEGYSRVLFYGSFYIVCSAGLITFNKYLLQVGRFPFPTALVFMHNTMGATLCSILFLSQPKWFPSLTDPAQRVSIDRSLLMYGVIPIALMFAVQLVLTNTAYLHSSIAFLQMMKEGNLVLVYFLSLLASLEVFQWKHFQVLCCVIFATSLTIKGEFNFSTYAFCLQAVGQLFECSRIVMSTILLTREGGKKLDAFTYLLLITPICMLMIGLLICGMLAFGPVPGFALPQMDDLRSWGPVLFLNGLTAFMLNLAITSFIKNSSAVAFILAGIIKDMAIVMVGFAIFGEEISVMQTFGFSLQLVAILIWSLMKTFPQYFEDGIPQGILRVFSSQPEEKKQEMSPKRAELSPKHAELSPTHGQQGSYSYGALEEARAGTKAQ